MKTLVLSKENLAEEVLVSYKGRTFMVKTMQAGQYGHERKVHIRIVKDDCETTNFKQVGILRLFSDNDINRTSEKEQSLIIGDTNFETCLDEAKEYIKKYVDFLVESK